MLCIIEGIQEIKKKTLVLPFPCTCPTTSLGTQAQQGSGEHAVILKPNLTRESGMDLKGKKDMLTAKHCMKYVQFIDLYSNEY